MPTYASLLASITPVFIALACGFALRRLGKMKYEADSTIMMLAVNFFYPCLIADIVLQNAALKKAGNVIGAPIAGALLLAGSYAFTALVVWLMRLRRPQPASTFIFTASLPNWGYLPIPLVTAIYDEATVGVLFVHNIGLELVLYSLGVWLLSGERSWRRVLNVPFIAMIAALILNLVHAADYAPKFALDTLHFLGQAAIPLSLIFAGAMLADSMREDGLHKDYWITFAGCAVKLAMLPPLVMLAARWLPCSVELKRVLVVQAAMPCAMVPVILSRHYGADSGTAVRIVMATTVLGLLTIPFWLQLGTKFVGL